MNRSLAGDEPHLVAYWTFDEGESAIAYDSTASGNDGEIVGPLWIESDVVMIGPSPVETVDKLAATWGRIRDSE